MKKILVVFTGGTIGSAVSDGVINVDENAGFLLFDLFDKAAGKSFNVTFDAIRPMQILSENCTPEHWAILAAALGSVDFSKYDGVIVTHGTDTLAYTAPLLGYLFSNIAIPLIITGSGRPLGTPGSNGLRNFISAVAFIVGEGLPGVYAVYENDCQETEVYLATRLLEADIVGDQFTAFGGVSLGTMQYGKFYINECALNPTKAALRAEREGFDFTGLRFDNTVIGISPYPGLDYDLFDLKKARPKAVLHKLYHSSTACAGTGKYALAGFVSRCEAEGVEVYLQSFKDDGREIYVSRRELEGSGAIPLALISYEAALMKLWLAVNQTAVPPREFMEHQLFFEFLSR